jgi:hypothetical protein
MMHMCYLSVNLKRIHDTVFDRAGARILHRVNLYMSSPVYRRCPMLIGRVLLFKTNFIQDKLHSRQTSFTSLEQMRDVALAMTKVASAAQIFLYLVIKEVALLTCFPSSEC